MIPLFSEPLSPLLPSKMSPQAECPPLLLCLFNYSCQICRSRTGLVSSWGLFVGEEYLYLLTACISSVRSASRFPLTRNSPAPHKSGRSRQCISNWGQYVREILKRSVAFSSLNFALCNFMMCTALCHSWNIKCRAVGISFEL